MENLDGTSSGPEMVDSNEKLKHLSTGLSFMRVLGSDYTKQLEIPQEFVLNINENVPHRFFIETAAEKRCWRVQVKQEGNSAIYLRDGWGDFVEAYSLEIGDVLIFEYEEKSIFRVKIYGKNGCEKSILDDTMGSIQHNLRNRTRNEVDIGSETSEHNKNLSAKYPPKRTIQKSSQKYNHGISKKRSESFGKPRSKATTLTDSGFSVTMNKRKTHQFKSLSIPLAVSVGKKLRKKDQVILKDTKGICWPIKLVHRRDGRDDFSLGWKQFIRGNKVAGGDKLDFEFCSDNLIQVYVTKASLSEDHCTQRQTQCQEEDMNCADDELVTYVADDKADGKANEVSTTTTNKGTFEYKATRKCSGSTVTADSSFSVAIHETKKHQFYHQSFPSAIYFGWNLFSKEEVVLQDAKGICWPVKIGHRVKTHGHHFTQGWAQFMMGNQIAGGDIIDFKLISDNLIQVLVTKCPTVNHHCKGTESQNEVRPVSIDCGDTGPATCSEVHQPFKASASPSRPVTELKNSSLILAMNEVL